MKRKSARSADSNHDIRGDGVKPFNLLPRKNGPRQLPSPIFLTAFAALLQTPDELGAPPTITYFDLWLMLLLPNVSVANSRTAWRYVLWLVSTNWTSRWLFIPTNALIVRRV